MIGLVKDLDLGTSNIHELSRIWLDSIKNGQFDLLLKASALPGGRVYEGGTVARAASDLFSAIFDNIRAPMQRMLDVGAQIFERDDLFRVVRLADELRKEKYEEVSSVRKVSFNDDRLRVRIRNKECIKDPRQIEARVAEAHDEYLNSISSWEWIHGKGRRSWDIPAFKENLGPIVNKLGDLSQADSERKAVEALLNVVKYFSRNPGERPTREKPWTSRDLYDFLKLRSNDTRMITYFYPDEDVPRVRLVNTLDMLELVLINSDFQFLLPENIGMLFLARIGFAWGDEPREMWPEPIQRMYSGGKKPATLRKVYQQMQATVSKMEGMIGYPYRPECDQVPDPTDENLEWRAGTGRKRVPIHIKRAFFNLRQIMSVVEENLNDVNHPHKNGMKYLRNMFYELYASNPDDVFSEDYYNYWSTAGLRNNLQIVLRLVKVGIMRQVGRYMMTLPDENEPDPATMTFLNSLIHTSATPGTGDLLRSVITAAPQEQLIWNVLNQVFQTLDGNDSDKIASLQQGSFYAVANLDKLNVTEVASRALSPAIRAHGKYLSKNAHLLVDLVGTSTAAQVMRALYETEDPHRGLPVMKAITEMSMATPDRVNDLFLILEAIDQNPRAQLAWEQFKSRFEKMTDSKEWAELDLGTWVDDAFGYLSHAPDTQEGKTVIALEKYLSRRSRSQKGISDALDLMALMAKNPDEFDRLMRTMAHYIDSGEMSEFVHMAERALREQ
jgi:hypothetical protein